MFGWLVDEGHAAAASLTGELHVRDADGPRTVSGAAAEAQALAAWQRLGSGLGAELDGVFAVALRGGSSGALYRDPSSLQNLYWCRVPGMGVAYASDLAPLLAMPGVPHRLAPEALHEYLRFLDIAAPRTLFDGVQALEAGHVLRVHADGATRVEHPLVPPAEPTPDEFDDAVERLGPLLRDAVAARLAGSTRPALFLSGGVDSTLIAAIAATVRPDITAITVGFAAPELDESPQAAAIARRLKLTHQVLRFERADLLSALGRCAAGMDQPTADPSLPATVLALDHCRRHFDAVLDGTGADEAVGAMPQRHQRVTVDWGDRMPRPLRRGIAGALRGLPPLAGYAPVFDFEHPAERFIRWGGFTRGEIERLCGQPVSFAGTTFFRTFDRFAREDHFARYSALVDAMPCERVNQAMRIADMRMRFPFCDRRVDTFLRHLRPDFRDRPGQPKRILRALLARHLPRDAWDAPKRGFTSPLLPLLRDEEGRLVRETLDAEVWRRRGLLDADAVSRLAEAFLAGDTRLTFRVWALVVLGAWLERRADLR